jgi:hypothetical protein
VKVWVPDTHNGDSVQVPVERQSKRITILAGITLSGATIRPLVVLPRLSFELELAALGLTDSAIFAPSKKGYISRDRFEIWIRKGVGPYLDQVRRDVGRPNARALLITDGCSAHDEIEGICAEFMIDLYRIPPHTSHLLQPLDMLTFGLMKKRFGRNRVDVDDLNKITQNIHKIILSFQLATPSSYNISAFKRAGIVLEAKYEGDHIALRGSVDQSHAIAARKYLASPECAIADRVAGEIPPLFDEPQLGTSGIEGQPEDILSLVPSVSQPVDEPMEGHCVEISADEEPAQPPTKRAKQVISGNHGGRKQKTSCQRPAKKPKNPMKKRVRPEVTQEMSR